MIPRIRSISIKEKYKLLVSFDDNVTVLYDVQDDINTLDEFKLLKENAGLFLAFSLDESRTVISWTDRIDLPSDTIREYGVIVD